MTFRVGQKVVCISQIPDGDGLSLPQVGSIYTIRAIFTKVLNPQFGVGFLLEEIRNAAHPGTGREWGFYSQRFRPLVENKTSVSFTVGADPESKRWDNRKK